MIENVIVGVLASLAASAVFYFGLFSLKPDIAISGSIAKDVIGGQTYYSIKVVNRSSRAAVGMKAMLCVTRVLQAHGGTTMTNSPIPLQVSELMTLAGYTEKGEPALYAVQFLTKADLEGEWGDDDTSTLTLYLYALDAFSGFGSVFHHTYRRRAASIIRGRFKARNSLEIASQ